MKLWGHFAKAPVRVSRIGHKRGKLKLKRQMLGVKLALAQEKEETKLMLNTYRKFSHGDASKEEMVEANKQFIDLLKGLGLGVFAILPFAPITIPLVVKIARWVGVEILPSAFSDMNNLKKTSKNNNKEDLNL